MRLVIENPNSRIPEILRGSVSLWWVFSPFWKGRDFRRELARDSNSESTLEFPPCCLRRDSVFSGRSRLSLLALEAFAAKHRASLCGLEGNRSFFAAIRTGRARFHFRIASLSGNAELLGPFRLARLTPLGFVLELLIVKEQLFSSRKYEFGAAVDTLQNSVLKFH